MQRLKGGDNMVAAFVIGALVGMIIGIILDKYSE